MPVTAKQQPLHEFPKVISLPHAAKRPFLSRIPRLAKWIIVIALCVLAAVLGWVWWSHLQAQVTYETAALERGSILANITATGTLNPVVNVQVGSQVSGNIKALYADFNTKVTKDQLVALIDPQIFQAQVDQASAAVASAGAGVVTSAAQVEKAKADLAGAVATKSNMESVLAKDKANALNAQFQWKRAEQLSKAGVVSDQDRDTAKAAYDASQAQITADQSQIDAAEQNIQSAKSQVNVAIAQWKTSQAQQQQAQAALAQTKINLEHTRILAPVSGTVIARHFDVGQTVAASFQAPDIFDIAQDLTQMQVDTNVDESDVGNIRTGQPASFTVDAYPGTTFRGNVTDVRRAPIVAQNVVTYDVVIQVANPDLKLFPGMTANVSILTAKQDGVFRAPNSALRFHPTADVLKKNNLPATKSDAPQIYLLTGNKLQAVPVKLGISDGRYTAVTSDSLKVGQKVVLRMTSANAPPAATSAPGGGLRRPGM
jgi:HlyD family secretion protein